MYNKIAYSDVTGTGKTFTGVKIAYWFHFFKSEREALRRAVEMGEAHDDDNHETPTPKTSRKRHDKTPSSERVTSKIMYCGPSNSSVDVALRELNSNCNKTTVLLHDYMCFFFLQP